MKPEEEFLKNRDIVPSLSFADGEPHTIELGKRKLETIKDKEGNDVEGVSYLVKENGTAKKFFTSSISLAQKLMDIKEGEVVVAQMKKGKNDAGEYRTGYEVKKGTVEEAPVPEKKDEPIEEVDVEDLPF